MKVISQVRLVILDIPGIVEVSMGLTGIRTLIRTERCARYMQLILWTGNAFALGFVHCLEVPSRL